MIISHFGIKVLVEDENHLQVPIHVSRHSGHVVGDDVQIENQRVKRLPRKNALSRKVHAKVQVIAANLDAVGIVTSFTPKTPKTFVDFVIVNALSQEMKPFIILTKIDEIQSILYEKELTETFGDEIDIFRVSAKTTENIPQLAYYLAQMGRTALVGVSGSGKSSLINVLMPNAKLAIGITDDATQHGQHVTTVSTLWKLPKGGELIDTPGVRDFEPVRVTSFQLAHYFPGFKDILEKPCKFRNCLHLNEPGCAVLQAVTMNKIKPERYANYVQMIKHLPN